jgi:hypothetical protein
MATSSSLTFTLKQSFRHRCRWASVAFPATFASHSLASITPTGTWRRRGDDDKFKFDFHAQTVFSTPVSMGECGVPGDVCIAFTGIDNTYRHVETARRGGGESGEAAASLSRVGATNRACVCASALVRYDHRPQWWGRSSSRACGSGSNSSFIALPPSRAVALETVVSLAVRGQRNGNRECDRRQHPSN